MHMADALVTPAVVGTMYACSAAVVAYSIRKVRLENDPKKIPLMGVMGAFVFATQMINFTFREPDRVDICAVVCCCPHCSIHLIHFFCHRHPPSP